MDITVRAVEMTLDCRGVSSEQRSSVLLNQIMTAMIRLMEIYVSWS